MFSGTVEALWRWPAKSMGGERVRALRIGPRGAAGDRAHAVLHHHKGEWVPLTAREAPRLLAWAAAYPFNMDAGIDAEHPPYTIVSDPDRRHTYVWGDPHLREALTADLGREVRLERDPQGLHDLPASMLVTTSATLRALSQELGSDVDPRRFRTNLHLDLDAPPWVEEEWEGRELVFAGGVRLKLLHPCERCAIPTRDPDTQAKWPHLLKHLARHHRQRFGINARVLDGGRVAQGETVELIVEQPAPSVSGVFGR
jgi:uncharacterized protein